MKSSLAQVCCRVKEEYPQFSERSIKILLPFPTYLCEAGFFFKYTLTTTTHHISISGEADMRIQLSSIKSDIMEICRNVKQGQPSH